MRTPTKPDVIAAADAIVTAYAATDTDAYFSGFAPEASFIFHTEAEPLRSRAEYEQLWGSWLASGWSVVSCESSDRHVLTFPGGAVFTHAVMTTVRTADGDDSYRERESIIFRDENGGLVAIHEHLSPLPTGV